jgi:hypothetical protein
MPIESAPSVKTPIAIAPQASMPSAMVESEIKPSPATPMLKIPKEATPIETIPFAATLLCKLTVAFRVLQLVGAIINRPKMKTLEKNGRLKAAPTWYIKN